MKKMTKIALFSLLPVFGAAYTAVTLATPEEAGMETPADEAAMEVEADAPIPPLAFTQEVTTNVLVESVNLETREVSVKRGDGSVATFEAGPEVRNLDQLDMGDLVTTTISQTVVLNVTTEGQVGMAAGTSATRANPGEKPGARMKERYQISAQVKSIDYDTRTLTLEGPDGSEEVFQVPGQGPHFSKIKVGDFIIADVTNTVSILAQAMPDAGEGQSAPEAPAEPAVE